MLLRTLFLILFVMIASTFSQTPPIETGVSQALAKWRAAHYSDVRYKLNITLEKGAPLMKGDIEIRVNLTDEGKQNDLILDWRTTQFANDKDKPFAEVVKVNEQIVKETAQDGVFDYQINKEHLIVSKKYLKTGENVLRIKFASPIKTSGAAVTRYVDKEDGAEYVYSLFVPSDASTAFPVFDQPDLKARFDLEILAPKEWEVISNSNGATFLDRALDGWTIPKNFNLHHFFTTKPISPYVFAFAAGEFERFAEKKTEVIKSKKVNEKGELELDANIFNPPFDVQNIDIYVRKSQAAKFKQHAAEVFRLNREGVKFLEDWFDYKFPFPKYDLVLIPEFPFGGMEHAGATFLREDRVIFPSEPTKNDYISRANVIFHEAAHQWFGDTVTMKWFDDLWLKEGFAEFMAYKTLEKVLPEYNAWKIFYERNKQAAYLTDVTRGTTPIYQEIPNLSSAKSAYGNIVYRKAPSFLRQAEFYLGEKEFQTAVRAFLKKHEFKNAEWTDLVNEFELASKKDLKRWANSWVKQRGLSIIRFDEENSKNKEGKEYSFNQFDLFSEKIENEDTLYREVTFQILFKSKDNKKSSGIFTTPQSHTSLVLQEDVEYIFPNYQDYGYGIFLLDEKSRAYVLENIQTEKDDFLRSMMWGSLWDSVRFYELAPEDYVELVIKNLNVETDESTIATLLGRVSTAMNYYLSEPPAVAGGLTPQSKNPIAKSNSSDDKLKPSATADGSDLQAQIEKLLIEKLNTAPTLGQKITFYRAFVSLASSENARNVLKEFLKPKTKDQKTIFELKSKDKFDIVTKLIILDDADGLKLLAELEKTETDDAAKRYAYAARAGIATAENKAKYWKDFTENKEISESWIESAFAVWNTPKHADLTLPYLEKALAELPNLKKNRKIFFVNGWLSSFIGGQKSAEALNIVNKFLNENPNLDKDLRNKILENADNLERAVKIREKFGK